MISTLLTGGGGGVAVEPESIYKFINKEKFAVKQLKV